MQTKPEAPTATTSVVERAVRQAAFGLLLEVDSRIDVPGIPQVDTSRDLDAPATGRAARSPAFQPPTRVRLDPRELQRRWSPVERTAERVR